MKTITGVVEKIAKHNGNTFGIKLQGNEEVWFNGFSNQLPSNGVKKGDSVTIEFETVKKNGTTYNNIQAIETDDIDERQEHIKNAVAYKVAIQLLSESEKQKPRDEKAKILDWYAKKILRNL